MSDPLSPFSQAKRQAIAAVNRAQSALDYDLNGLDEGDYRARYHRAIRANRAAWMMLYRARIDLAELEADGE